MALKSKFLYSFCHDMSVLSQMPERLTINSLTDMDGPAKTKANKTSKQQK
jgi:hypothetical protein